MSTHLKQTIAPLPIPLSRQLVANLVTRRTEHDLSKCIIFDTYENNTNEDIAQNRAKISESVNVALSSKTKGRKVCSKEQRATNHRY